MLLNKVEKLLMNNPIREAAQRYYEARRLRELGGTTSGAQALEIGCGRGVGVEIILEQFGADTVDAFDLDPDMVRRAQARLEGFGDRVSVWIGDATDIRAEDSSYDAVFDFGIIHHVPDWRQTLVEVHRVLKPGGRFYAEEVLSPFITNSILRRVLLHPKSDRFDTAQFCRALHEAGLPTESTREVLGVLLWVVATKK